MINIVTKKPNRKYKFEFKDCESFFKAKVYSTQFSDADFYAMKIIDGAELSDPKRGTIETAFGTTTIDNLSSGCKIVLIYLYIQRNREFYDNDILLDVTECGANALDVLFDLMENYNNDDIVLFLGHSNNLFQCKEHDYLFNGQSKRKLY